MQPNIPKGSFHYPTQVTQYNGSSDLGPLNIRDTESLFTLVHLPQPATPADPPIVPPLYTLPGVPHDIARTPIDKLLLANAKAVGALPLGIAICPLDYFLQPSPVLADFRAIIFQSIGDSALIRWTGSLWSVFNTTGTTIVVVPEQSFP